jgi:hypothetical protein
MVVLGACVFVFVKGGFACSMVLTAGKHVAQQPPSLPEAACDVAAANQWAKQSTSMQLSTLAGALACSVQLTAADQAYNCCLHVRLLTWQATD